MPTKIKYIGKKDRKIDTPYVAGTGTIWNGYGDVQEVPDGAVSRLLEHTDSFVLADDAEKTSSKQTSKVVADEAPYIPPQKNVETDVEAKAPLIDIRGVTDEQVLRDYALREFGHTFHHKAGLERMRNEIIGMMNRN